MRRELKVDATGPCRPPHIIVAKHIPMRRELKETRKDSSGNLVRRKAHPDEKGTESDHRAFLGLVYLLRRKAHPDEKGTES